MVWLFEEMDKEKGRSSLEAQKDSLPLMSVAVASHSIFIFALTCGVLKFEDPDDVRGKMFGTGEMRSFEITKSMNAV